MSDPYKEAVSLRDICEGYAETRLVAVEKYNNLPGYTPLAQVGESKLLIGRKRDEVLEDLRKQNEALVQRTAELEEANKGLKVLAEGRKITADENARLYRAAMEQQLSTNKRLEALQQSNALYEADIGKIRVAVGQIYMDKILGPKPIAGGNKRVDQAFLKEAFIEEMRAKLKSSKALEEMREIPQLKYPRALDFGRL